MNEIKELKKLIEKYDKCKENNLKGLKDLIGEDGSIVEKCQEILNKVPVKYTLFETKGYDNSGYDLNSYVFVWIDTKTNLIDGVVLDVERW